MFGLDDGTLSRREYLRLAVATGGASAISACVELRGDVEYPSGTEEYETLPTRQHAWDGVLDTDDDGNVRPPEHHAYLAFELTTDPSDDDWESARETVEAGFKTLERAYEWSADGLLFTVGYSPAYFDRFEESLSPSVDLPEPEALTDRENPVFDTFDVFVHLASDHPEVVLRTEEAVTGERETLNGEPVEEPLSSILSPVEDRRRTGFVGAGKPASYTDHDGVPSSIPEEAPFFMGFRSGFAESQASEDRVTIEDGPFAGGTTQHLESMDLQLDVWFEQDSHYQRVAKLFSPEHADDDIVGEIGETLGSSTEIHDAVESADIDARERGVVGHAQKAARAREDGQPILLRRDVNTIDGDRPGLHFLSLQREIDEFVRVRDAMTGSDLAETGSIGPILNNGILQYIFVTSRGNFLVPPRALRALPDPDPDP